MGANKKVRSAASRVVGVLLTAGAIASAVVTAPASAATTVDTLNAICADSAEVKGGTIVVALRGSGESGAGAVNASAYNILRTRQDLEGRKTQLFIVDYPSRRVEDLRYLFVGDGRYFQGLEEGVTKLNQTLDAYTASSCGQKGYDLVLSGYSQGAMVIHRVMQRRGNYALAGLGVKGVVLVGDGDRRRADPVATYGNAIFPSGVGQAFPAISGSRNVNLGRQSEGFYVSSLCNFLDPVCDYSNFILQVFNVGAHFSYPQSNGLRQAVLHAAGYEDLGRGF